MCATKGIGLVVILLLLFVKLDEHMDNRFLVMHGCTPNIPLDLWQATIVDEDEQPRLKWMGVKE